VAHAAVADERFREEFHKTYPLAATGRVSLDNINGAVKITGWDQNQVKLDAVKTADAQEKLPKIEIRVDASQDAIHIQTKYADCENGRHCNNPGSVEYTLMVPRNARVDEIKLVNGSLDIDQVNGEVHGTSVNGAVTGRNLGGRVELSAVNGSVTAALTAARMKNLDAISLHSVNGRVELTVPANANADVSAQTVNGSIRTDFDLRVIRSRYGPGAHLDGRIGTGGARIELNTVNGSIEVRHASEGRL
jgi:DUF4097 and DUF4098 domain-containing protein YvlB